MLGYFKRRREARERKADLTKLAELLGEHLRAELDLFIEMQIKPTRAAFLEVFRGQLETLDQRIAESGDDISRLEAAGIDYRLMLSHWQEREAEQYAAAEDWLAEQFEEADALGVRGHYEAAIKDALTDQQLALMSDGLGVLLEMVPEARSENYDPSHHEQ